MSEASGMIRFTCPACDKTFQAEAQFAGHKVRCSACGNAIIVPAGSAAPAARSAPRTAPAPRSTPAPPAASGEASLLDAVCPRCGKSPVYAGFENPNKKGRWFEGTIPVNTWLTDVPLESLVCGSCHYLESYVLDAGVRRTMRKDWPKVRPDRARFTDLSVRLGQCPKCGNGHVHGGRKRGEAPDSGRRGGNSLRSGFLTGGAIDNYVCTRCGYVERYVAAEKDLATLAKRWPAALREREQTFAENSIRSGECPKCRSGRTHTNARMSARTQHWSIPVAPRLDQAFTLEWACGDCGYLERYMLQDRDMETIRRKWTRLSPARR